MVKYCIICKYHFKVGDSRSFHRIPSNKERRETWLPFIFKYVGKNSICKGSVLCSDHFLPSDFTSKPSGVKYLKPFAFPTILGTFEQNANHNSSNFKVCETDNSYIRYGNLLLLEAPTQKFLMETGLDMIGNVGECIENKSEELVDCFVQTDRNNSLDSELPNSGKTTDLPTILDCVKFETECLDVVDLTTETTQNAEEYLHGLDSGNAEIKTDDRIDETKDLTAPEDIKPEKTEIKYEPVETPNALSTENGEVTHNRDTNACGPNSLIIKEHNYSLKDTYKCNEFGDKRKRKKYQHRKCVTYRCVSCDFTTKYKTTFQKHASKHPFASKLRMYKSNDCDYSTRFPDNFKNSQWFLKDYHLIFYKCGEHCQCKTHASCSSTGGSNYQI